MTEAEKENALKGLSHTRDNLQKIMSEARNKRAELSLSNREKYNDYLQRLGEVSFIIGAAIVPLVIVSHAKIEIDHIAYVLVGVCFYLINGFLALWITKDRIEQDADDAPHIGLDEEIATYPIINAINKLLYELEDKEIQKEYWSATNVDLLKATNSVERKARISFWLDILLVNFVVASLLVVRAAWPYGDLIYWLTFAAILLSLLSLALKSYKRAIINQGLLHQKRMQLQSIRAKYEEWFNNAVMKRNSK